MYPFFSIETAAFHNAFAKGSGVVLLVGSLLLSATSASAFTSRLGAKVNPVNADVFEVVPKSGGIGQDYWCGAGDYARRELKAGWSDVVYISRGRGPSETTGKRSAVQFTMNAQVAGASPGASYKSDNSLERGEGMSVQSAFGYCNKLYSGF